MPVTSAQWLKRTTPVRRFFRLCSLKQRHRFGLDPFTLLMDVGGIQPKACVLDREFAVGFRDAAFA